MSKSIVQVSQKDSVQKHARKNTKYSGNETILKIGRVVFAWAIAFAKYSIWPKILNCRKHVKIDCATLLEIFCAKNPGRKTKYCRHETILNIGHLAKAIAFAWAIAFAKYSTWAKNLNCLKYVKIDYVFALE